MKKLRITLNGKSYEVDVEILQDDNASPMSYMPMAASPMAVAPPMATPSPASAPSPTPSAPAGDSISTCRRQCTYSPNEWCCYRSFC